MVTSTAECRINLSLPTTAATRFQICARSVSRCSMGLCNRALENTCGHWENGRLLVIVLFHLGALAALFTFTWRALAAAIFLYWMATGLGISMGYHRLLTHRSYKVPVALEYFFAVCGALTLEGGPIFWVATHRVHHQNSDKPGDPHSPNEGSFWAHMGWIIFGEKRHNDTTMMSRYAPDLAKDPFYRWLNTY